MIYSYGIEGETYTLDADGTPHFTALITDNPDGLGMITACNLYAIQTGVGYLDQTRFQSGFSEAALEAGDIWMKALEYKNGHLGMCCVAAAGGIGSSILVEKVMK